MVVCFAHFVTVEMCFAAQNGNFLSYNWCINWRVVWVGGVGTFYKY